MTTNVQVPTVPAWRFGRVLQGVGLGLIAHVLAVVVMYAFAQNAKGLEGILGVVYMMIIEAVNAVVMVIALIVQFRRRHRDLATGMLVAWLAPVAIFGIVTGIQDLRQS